MGLNKSGIKNLEETVGDYVTLQRGSTYKGSQVGEDGPPLLGLGSIEPGGGFRRAKFKTFGGECPEKWMVDPGDLYVALKGATKDGSMVGSVARLPEDLPRGRLTQDTARLDFKDSTPSVKRHLHWVLRTPQYRQYCEGRVVGSASASFSREDFLSFPVPRLTSDIELLEETLDVVEAKIELNRRMNRTLESMARAWFKSWFVDFDPVKANAAGKPTLPPDLAAAFPAGFAPSPLGDIPEGWEVASFSEHIKAVRGLSYKGKGLCGADDGLPMHNLNSIYEGGGYKHEGIKYYAGDHKDKHLLRAGDMIITNTEQGHEHRLIGHAAIVPDRFGDTGLFSHHIYRITPKKASPLTRHYLYYLFNTDRWHKMIAGYSNGTSINMLPLDALRMPLLVVPPAELVEQFDTYARSVTAKNEQAHEESRTLTALRDALLPKLLAGGKMRVGEAQHEGAHA